MIEEKHKVVATRRDFKCPYCPRAVFESGSVVKFTIGWDMTRHYSGSS